MNDVFEIMNKKLSPKDKEILNNEIAECVSKNPPSYKIEMKSIELFTIKVDINGYLKDVLSKIIKTSVICSRLSVLFLENLRLYN